MTDRRYPFDRLAAAMGLTEPQAARRLGLSGSTEVDYRRRGVTERVGDRLAVKAGLHRFEVWPEMADHDTLEFTRPCDECGERFWPRRRDQRYCSKRCRRRPIERAAYRRRYQTDPLFAERERERARVMYAETRTYVLSRQRRRRERTELGETA